MTPETTRRWPFVALFLYVWLMVGFATGTLTLLGPARWVTSALRASSWSGQENRVMVLVILTFVVVSFLLARLLTGLTRRARHAHVRVGVPGVLTLAAAVALWGWMNPAVYASLAGSAGGAAQVKTGGAEFLFGPYPDRERLKALKKDGFRGVVSLQHPAVVPFEPQGIALETQAAKEIGLEFVHAPMLPWVASNEASLALIRDLAAKGQGRYYVHCGLGRDRTNVVKRMLERLGAQVPAAAAVPTVKPRSFSVRVAGGNVHMERGDLVALGGDDWLAPYPNQHELFGNLLAGQAAHVLLLLDPENGQQKQWIDHLQGLFDEHGVAWSLETLHEGQRARAADLVAIARALPRPLVVIAPHTPPAEGSSVATTFMAEWGVSPMPGAGATTRAASDPDARGARTGR